MTERPLSIVLVKQLTYQKTPLLSQSSSPTVTPAKISAILARAPFGEPSFIPL
ncbi:hypothetical protein [Bartonella sp. B39]